jgi:hypothetical protein
MYRFLLATAVPVCAVDSGLDLSYSFLNDMTEGMAYEKGHTATYWEILEEGIHTSDTVSEDSSPATGTSSDGPCATQSP